MSQYYFTVREAEDEQRHICTILAQTDEELNDKLTHALNEHFDSVVWRDESVKREDCLYGMCKTVKINVERYPDYDHETTIEITQTWIY